jgi:hypothetical protein
VTPNETALVRDLVANLQTPVLARLNEQDLQTARRFDAIDRNVTGVHDRLDAQNGRLRKVEQRTTVHDFQLKAARTQTRKHALLSGGAISIVIKIAEVVFTKLKPLISLAFWLPL